MRHLDNHRRRYQDPRSWKVMAGEEVVQHYVFIKVEHIIIISKYYQDPVES